MSNYYYPEIPNPRRLYQYIRTGSVVNGEIATLIGISYLFIKNKQTSNNEGVIKYYNENDELLGSISIEPGENKFYSADIMPFYKIEIIAANSECVIEFEYY